MVHEDPDEVIPRSRWLWSKPHAIQSYWKITGVPIHRMWPPTPLTYSLTQDVLLDGGEDVRWGWRLKRSVVIFFREGGGYTLMSYVYHILANKRSMSSTVGTQQVPNTFASHSCLSCCACRPGGRKGDEERKCPSLAFSPVVTEIAHNYTRAQCNRCNIQLPGACSPCTYFLVVDIYLLDYNSYWTITNILSGTMFLVRIDYGYPFAVMTTFLLVFFFFFTNGSEPIIKYFWIIPAKSSVLLWEFTLNQFRLYFFWIKSELILKWFQSDPMWINIVSGFIYFDLIWIDIV